MDDKTQFIELQVDGGVDNYTALEKVEPPKHLNLEDMSLAEPGAVQVRQPYADYAKTVQTAGVADTQSRARALITDGESLIAINDFTTQKYFNVASVWDGAKWLTTDYAGMFPVTSARSLVDLLDVEHIQHEHLDSGFTCVVARVSSAGATSAFSFCVSRDGDESNLYTGFLGITPAGTKTNPNGNQPKLVTVGSDRFVLLYVEGTALKSRVFDTTAPQSGWSTAATIHNLVSATNKNIDAWQRSGNVYVAYNSATDASVCRVTYAGATPTLAVNQTALFGGQLGDWGVVISGADNGSHTMVVLARLDSATGTLRASSLNGTTLAVVQNITLAAGLTSVIEIAVLTYTDAYDAATVAWSQLLSAGIVSVTTKRRRMNITTGALYAVTHAVNGVYISKKPLRIQSQDVFGFAQENKKGDRTEFLVADIFWDNTDAGTTTGRLGAVSQPPVIAQFNPLGTPARPVNFYCIAPRVVNLGGTGYKWQAATYESITHGLNDGEAGSKVRLHTIDLRSHVANRSFVFDRMLFVGGSYPRRWSRDVQQDTSKGSFTARGFQAIVPPHAPSCSSLAQSAGGALTALATYTYVFTFEFVGQDGRRSQSAPSEAMSLTLGGGNNTITPQFATTSIQWEEPSMRRGELHFNLVIWRTQGNATDAIYYRVGVVDTNAASFTDTFSDASIADNEILYTVGGELPNRAPPPSLAMFAWKDRIVCLHAETGELWISKSWDASKVGGWNGSLAVQTNVWNKPPVFACAMDDKIVVFWEDAIGLVYGEPAADNGDGGTLAPPVIIKRGIGLGDVASVVDTAEAILFRSPHTATVTGSIYALGRDLSVIDVGRPVASLMPTTESANECVGAHYFLDREEVRFVFPEVMLVYHTGRKAWGTHLLGDHGEAAFPSIAASASYGGALQLCWETEWDANVGFVWGEDLTSAPGANVDATSGSLSISRPVLRQTTGWVKVSTLGQERIQRLWLIGIIPTTATLSLFYDYSLTPVETKSFAAVGSTTQQVYEIHLPREDCHAFMFDLSGHFRLVSARVEIVSNKGTYQRNVVRV